MKKLLLALTISAVSVFGAACASSGGSPDAAAATEAIAAAKAALKKAAGNEWRDTGKFIKKAEKLASEGKIAEAVKLAKKAKSQAEMAVKQAEEQKNAGPHL